MALKAVRMRQVHNDYTVTSAPRRMEMLAQPSAGNDTLGKRLGGRPLLPPEDLGRRLKGRCTAIVLASFSERAILAEYFAGLQCRRCTVDREQISIYQCLEECRADSNRTDATSAVFGILGAK
eukprot:SAG31_NODE_1245_length_9134_cov_6.012064_3_plen_123_part_00